MIIFYTWVIAALMGFGTLYYVMNADERAGSFLINALMMLPIFGRVLGWW